MDTTIVQQTKNPFLMREEILMGIDTAVTPSLDAIREVVGKDADTVVVRKVHANFGKQKFLAEIMVYDSKEAKEKVETIPKKIRKKMEEERKAAEEAARKAAKEEAEKKAAEEAAAKEAAEKPVEEVKEESDDKPVEASE
jgi:ribosomal protein S24E